MDLSNLPSHDMQCRKDNAKTENVGWNTNLEHITTLSSIHPDIECKAHAPMKYKTSSKDYNELL
jgi:hypothetical protein